MNKKVLSLFLIVASNVLAQAFPPNTNDTVKIYHLRYSQPERIRDLLASLGVYAKGDDALRSIVVKGAPEQQKEIERLITELDQPAASQGQKDVEVTVHVILASESAINARLLLAPAMKPVIEQLKGVFPYNNYQQLGTILLRSRQDQLATTSGVIKNPSENSDARSFPYTAQFKATVDAQLRRIHFESFRLFINLSPQDSSRRAAFETSLDASENEKVVIGKSNIDDGSSAIFAVVTARIAQ
jgi:type II secretory pathway component GspD/PulD (secretin)